MNVKLAIGILALLAVTGCTATSILDRTQTAQYFPDKHQLTVVAYVPADLTAKKLVATSATSNCSGFETEIDAGVGFTTAVIGGLEAAFSRVVRVATPLTPAVISANGGDLGVSVRQAAETATITAGVDVASSATISTNYHTTLALDFMNNAGDAVLGMAASGSGSHNVSGNCQDMAPSLKLSMETALRQIADTIARTSHNAPELGASGRVRR